MALGLQALGPLGLWESLAGSVLFPGQDRYCFSTHCKSMQFHRHQDRHAREPSLSDVVHRTTRRSSTCRPSRHGLETLLRRGVAWRWVILRISGSLPPDLWVFRSVVPTFLFAWASSCDLQSLSDADQRKAESIVGRRLAD